MGGSLGAGFSDGDRTFVIGMGPQLGTTKEGNLKIMLINDIIADRQIAMSELASNYAAENGALDVDFEKALRLWVEENSIEDEYNARLSSIDQFFSKDKLWISQETIKELSDALIKAEAAKNALATMIENELKEEPHNKILVKQM